MGKTLQIGDILEDKYEIQQKIGEGGMGEVYQGRHITLETRVAIKVLLPFAHDNDAMHSRFKAEAQSSARIRHPNVVEVYDFGITPDDRPFFAMQYLEGESLAELLARRKVLEQRRAVEIAEQILNGLISAHKKNIVHRDLKPENIFIARTEDKREVVKILDFGISKIVHDGTASRHSYPHINVERTTDGHRFKTESGEVLGTPGYMAPESLTGNGTVDHRVDLFAMGVIIFEMLTGRRPFRGKTPQETMINTATKPVPKPRAINPQITPEMEKLCLIALSKDPDHRFHTAQEFLKYLTAAASGQSPRDVRTRTMRIGLPAHFPGISNVYDEEKLSAEPDMLSSEISLELDLRGVENPEIFQPTTHSPLSPDNEMAATAPQPTWQPNTPTSVALPPTQRRLALPVVSPRKRRASFLFSHFRIIAGLVVGALLIYVIATSTLLSKKRNTGADAMRSRTADTPVSSSLAPLSPTTSAPPPVTVTIDLDITPSDVQIRVNDRLMMDRPLRVPLSNSPAKIEINKTGFQRKVLVITPNAQQTISATLEKDNTSPDDKTINRKHTKMRIKKKGKKTQAKKKSAKKKTTRPRKKKKATPKRQ
ncbi:MAG: serine/threonine protein kinase [Deltaproteobacteria bacterium]|nr:serine/threonine protein kinase [Deltaproteobacteria bacterium]